MTVTITFTGRADEVTYEMEALLNRPAPISTPAVSYVSSDTPKTQTDTDGEPAGTQAPPPTKRRGRPAKLPEGPALNVVANISTGDERVDPESVTQPDEVPAEQPAEEAKTYTMDDVRNAATPYIKKHTMALAQIDLQDCLEAAVGIRQISKLDPTDQAQMKKAIDAFVAAGNADARFVKAAT